MSKKRVIGATYYYVYVNTIIPHSISCKDNDRSTDRIRFSNGNYFNTREEAEAIAKQIDNLLREKI